MDLYQRFVDTLGFAAQSSWMSITAVTFLSMFLSTYAVTTLNSALALQSRKDGREPPGVPYFIPFIGNSISFAWDPAAFVASTT